MLAILQHALSSPQLHFTDIQSFRQRLSSGLQQYPSWHSAIYLGAQAATPGMAFLAGYQNAIRCLDASCPHDQFAAFCISEKGIKKPWDMATRISLSDNTYRLDGQKGYVMLLPNDLDRMYVVAKNENDELRCVYLAANSEGVSATAALKAPFVEDIPHTGVSFDSVSISPEQVLNIDGHRQANKPFRYWEDVHVALAMLAWMHRELIENGKSLAELDNFVRLICQLIENFEEQPDYYSPAIFTLLDESHELMDCYSKELLDESQKIWKKDRLLLQMGQKIRHLVRAKLTA